MARKRNIYDVRVDYAIQNIKSIIKELEKRAEGTLPFRMQEMTRADQMVEIAQMTPEDEAFGRQQFGDAIMDRRQQKIDKLRGNGNGQH